MRESIGGISAQSFPRLSSKSKIHKIQNTKMFGSPFYLYESLILGAQDAEELSISFPMTQSGVHMPPINLILNDLLCPERKDKCLDMGL